MEILSLNLETYEDHVSKFGNFWDLFSKFGNVWGPFSKFGNVWKSCL
jgi:hypothetical protein